MPAGCHIKLEKLAKEYILNNIQSSIFNVRDLRRMMINFANNFSNRLNLKNFLENYGLDIDRFYSNYSFYQLLFETGYKSEYDVKHVTELKQSLRRFSRIDSKKLLYFSKKLLMKDVEFTLLNKVEELMLGMFHYTIWGDKPEISYVNSLIELKVDNPDIVRESKNQYNHAMPYVFLGNGKYVSHQGNNPLQIVLRMDHPIPERIIRESNLSVVN